MESEPERSSLSQVESLRARVARMPREHAVLQLGNAVLLSAYIGVLAFTGSVEGGASVMSATPTPLVLVPIIVSSGLIAGANERFDERLLSTRAEVIVALCFGVMLVSLFWWGIATGGYPWWVAVISAAVAMIICGLRPARVLWRTPIASARPDADVISRPLSLPVRLTTAFLGIFFGLTCAVVFVSALAWLVMMLGLVIVAIALLARGEPWSFLLAGYEWRRPQWVAFGAASLIMLLLAVLIIATDVVTPAVAVGAGVLVAASLIVSAFLSGSTRGASAA